MEGAMDVGFNSMQDNAFTQCCFCFQCIKQWSSIIAKRAVLLSTAGGGDRKPLDKAQKYCKLEAEFKAQRIAGNRTDIAIDFLPPSPSFYQRVLFSLWLGVDVIARGGIEPSRVISPQHYSAVLNSWPPFWVNPLNHLKEK